MPQCGDPKSATTFELIDVTAAPPRLTTPSGLTKVERSPFDLIVFDASPPHHFTDSDCNVVSDRESGMPWLARSAAKVPTKVSIWERAVRVQLIRDQPRLHNTGAPRSETAGSAIRQFRSKRADSVGEMKRCSTGEEMRHAASAMRGGSKSIACIQMVPTIKRVTRGRGAQRDNELCDLWPNGLRNSCPSLVRWRHTWHCCMSWPRKESNETSNRMRAPTFSWSGARSVLNFAGCSNLDGGTVVCPR